MPAPEGRHRYQAALLWNRVGVDEFGRFTVEDEPTEIRVQISDTKVNAMDPKGDTVSLDATAIVDRDIEIGSRLAVATLAVWNESGSAEDDSELYEVKTYNRTPDIRNRASFYQVGLMRFRNPS